MCEQPVLFYVEEKPRASPEREYLAIFKKPIHNGKHGAYAVAWCQELKENITFSLTKKGVWKEELDGNIFEPESGTEVILSNLVKKVRGWRANHARLLKPGE